MATRICTFTEWVAELSIGNRPVKPGMLAPIGAMWLAALCGVCISGCGRATTPRATSVVTRVGDVADTSHPQPGRQPSDIVSSDSVDALAYEGVDSRGIPHYATEETFSSADADVLRRAYGVEDPHRLYVSDSTEEGILKYDTQVKPCRTCYVNSYRLGYVSVRKPGESWEQAERRVRATPAREFTGSAFPAGSSTEDLDPDVRPLAERMLHDAREAGFHMSVTATYRSPLREAFLMAEGKGRTHTLTSNHSYGRALDIVIGDGDRRHPQTRREWIAFRQWVTRYRAPTFESFRILGRADRTWDWPHVELPSAHLGFGTIAAAIQRGRACLAAGSTTPCNFPPHLPAHLEHALVQ